MLCLTRKVGEKVFIGETITVQILEVRGGKVRLGISADPGTAIVRDDVVMETRREEIRGAR